MTYQTHERLEWLESKGVSVFFILASIFLLAYIATTIAM